MKFSLRYASYQAFLILRRHGSFIISLFAMMISTGLPELSCERDLNYLRETMVCTYLHISLLNVGLNITFYFISGP